MALTTGPGIRVDRPTHAFRHCIALVASSRRPHGEAGPGSGTSGLSTTKSYLILKNGKSTVGIFRGMFEGNILTFNPGLTTGMERIADFLDVREIESRLEPAGIEVATPIDPEAGESGPGSVTVVDSDGNPILTDQFF